MGSPINFTMIFPLNHHLFISFHSRSSPARLAAAHGECAASRAESASCARDAGAWERWFADGLMMGKEWGFECLIIVNHAELIVVSKFHRS